MIVLEYKFHKGYKPDKKKIKQCDRGFKGMRSALLKITWKKGKIHYPAIWLITRLYRRIITKKGICYDLYLIKS